MVFIIMNLLVGLTVNRIEELMKTGEKIQAMKRVEDIAGMAKLVFEPEFWRNMKCNRMPNGIMQRLIRSNSTKVFISILGF